MLRCVHSSNRLAECIGKIAPPDGARKRLGVSEDASNCLVAKHHPTGVVRPERKRLQSERSPKIPFEHGARAMHGMNLRIGIVHFVEPLASVNGLEWIEGRIVKIHDPLCVRHKLPPDSSCEHLFIQLSCRAFKPRNRRLPNAIDVRATCRFNGCL